VSSRRSLVAMLPGEDPAQYRERVKKVRQAEAEREERDAEFSAAVAGARTEFESDGSSRGVVEKGGVIHVPGAAILTDEEIKAVIQGRALAKAIRLRAERFHEVLSSTKMVHK
jgi:hypothetical protein